MTLRPGVPALALLLAACGQALTEAPPPATTTEEPQTPIIPTDANAGPSGTDNMTWQFTPAGSADTGTVHPRLMYASYGSEGMALNLQCEGGTMLARLWRGQQRASWPFTLQSGAARADLAGTGEGESEVIVTASLPVSAPILNNFRDTGAISLIEHGQTQALDAINDQERQSIRDFFQACS